MDIERMTDMAMLMAELNMIASVIDGIAGDFKDLGYVEIADLYTLMWKQITMNADDLDKKIKATFLEDVKV